MRWASSSRRPSRPPRPPRILSTSHDPVRVAARARPPLVEPLPMPLPGQPLEGPALELFVGRLASAGGELVDLRRDEAVLRSLLEASGGIPLAHRTVGGAGGPGRARPAVAPDRLARRRHRRVLRHGGRDEPAGLPPAGLRCLPGRPRCLRPLWPSSRGRWPSAAAAQLERHGLVELSPDERVRMAARPGATPWRWPAHTDDAALAEDALLALGRRDAAGQRGGGPG